MKLNIRPMTQSDKSQVMRVLAATPEFKPSEVPIAEELIDAYLDSGPESGYHILVAEAESLVIGYICYGPTPLTEGTWDIYWVAVAREKQGLGVGGALMAAADSKIKEARARLVLLETSSTAEYEKTRRFYQHQGYELVCRIPDFYTPGDDKLVYQKRFK